MQRLHRRGRDAGYGGHRSRFGQRLGPRLQERVVRAGSGLRALGLVEEATEADDVTGPSRAPRAHANPSVRVETGFAPSSRSTCGVDEPSRMPATTLSSDADATARPADPFAADAKLICGVKNTPPGRSTLPRSPLSAFTASALNKLLVCASGAPPMMATDGVFPRARARGALLEQPRRQ